VILHLRLVLLRSKVGFMLNTGTIAILVAWWVTKAVVRYVLLCAIKVMMLRIQDIAPFSAIAVAKLPLMKRIEFIVNASRPSNPVTRKTFFRGKGGLF
jgi:hypothetical protein